MQSEFFFQYCQKLVVLSGNHQQVLLAKRKGEDEYNGTFSFIGGKLEVTDESLVAGMQREKNEEVGADVRLRILPNESYNVLFRKKDGSSMVLPHIAAEYISGIIQLNEEYDEYRWVALADLPAFEPKIPNLPAMATWATTKLVNAGLADFVEI